MTEDLESRIEALISSCVEGDLVARALIREALVKQYKRDSTPLKIYDLIPKSQLNGGKKDLFSRDPRPILGRVWAFIRKVWIATYRAYFE